MKRIEFLDRRELGKVEQVNTPAWKTIQKKIGLRRRLANKNFQYEGKDEIEKGPMSTSFSSFPKSLLLDEKGCGGITAGVALVEDLLAVKPGDLLLLCVF